MRTLNIVHQQLSQLKWHILSSFALVMLLPIEQAFINLKDSDGFYADNSTIIPATLISVLLAGVIACSNIQADFKQNRYTFWRSKPVNAKFFIVQKYLTGLIPALLIMMSPTVLHYATTTIGDIEPLVPVEKVFIVFAFLLCLMTYSFCFACNILIRKTARSWLVGLTLTCLLFILSFITPSLIEAPKRDMGQHFINSFFFISIAATIFTIILAILAADKNWHIKTNLKGFLWTGAAFIFSLMMLFSTQIANIKLLDQKEVNSLWHYPFYSVGNKILVLGSGFVEVDNNKISLTEDHAVMSYKPLKYSSIISEAEQAGKIGKIKGQENITPFQYTEYYELDGKTYYIELLLSYDKHEKNRNYKNILLIRHEVSDDTQAAPSILDLSGLLKIDADRPIVSITPLMRKVNDKLVIAVENRYSRMFGHTFGFAVVDLSNPNELDMIDEKIVSKIPYVHSLRLDNKEHQTFLAQLKGISLQERIKFSIDIMAGLHFGKIGREIYDHSIVQIDDDKISFAGINYDRTIIKFEVTRFEDDKVYYKAVASKRFTFLEGLTFEAGHHGYSFVQNGRLYIVDSHDLCVYDISGERLTKQGHYIRHQSEIRDIAVLEDGNILIATLGHKRINKKDWDNKYVLKLLKKP